MALADSSTSSRYTEQLDFLVKTAKKEDDEVVIQRLHRFLVEAAYAPLRQQYEEEASLNYSYVENDFYTAEELEEFARRGQPPTKRNEIAPILERLAGQFIQTRQSVTFLGRNTPQDDQTATLAQDYQRWNDQVNNFEFEEQDLAWDGLVGGVGWLKAQVKTNDLGYKYVCFRAVNPFHIYKDPFSVRYDPNEDAKYIIEGSWMDMEDCIALVPDKEDEIREHLASAPGYGTPPVSSIKQSLLNESNIARHAFSLMVQARGGRTRVRPFEFWYKRKVKVYYIFGPDSVLALPIPLERKQAHTLVKQLGEQFTIEEKLQDRMYSALLLGGLLLHHDVSEHETNLFPYVPFYSGIRKNGAPLPIASRMVPINEVINKLESKAIVLVTNRQTIAEKNAVKNVADFQEQKARPDGYMEVEDGALSSGRVLNTNNLEVSQGHLSVLQEAKSALARVALPDESMGRPGEVRSGTGIARKQMMGSLITMPVQNNLRRTRHIRGKLSYALMKQYLTEEIAFQITDDPMAPRTVTMTRSAIQALKEQIYDIVITEEKDYATLREQQTEMLLTVLPQLAQLGPAYVQLGIQLSDLRDKEGLMKLVQQQAQQGPVLPKISLTQDWKDLTPEMKAYYALSAYKSEELAQAILQEGDDPAFLKKIKADLINTQIKEGTRAQVEQGRLDLSALQTAVEGRMQLRQEFSSQLDQLNQGAPPS